MTALLELGSLTVELPPAGPSRWTVCRC